MCLQCPRSTAYRSDCPIAAGGWCMWGSSPPWKRGGRGVLTASQGVADLWKGSDSLCPASGPDGSCRALGREDAGAPGAGQPSGQEEGRLHLFHQTFGSENAPFCHLARRPLLDRTPSRVPCNLSFAPPSQRMEPPSLPTWPLHHATPPAAVVLPMPRAVWKKQRRAVSQSALVQAIPT